jgi:hypothetical protein
MLRFESFTSSFEVTLWFLAQRGCRMPLNQTQRELLRDMMTGSISAAIDAKLAPYLELCVKPLNVSGDTRSRHNATADI